MAPINTCRFVYLEAEAAPACHLGVVEHRRTSEGAIRFAMRDNLNRSVPVGGRADVSRLVSSFRTCRCPADGLYARAILPLLAIILKFNDRAEKADDGA